MTVFTFLLLAHLLGDFFLQPSSWVSDKRSRKIASPLLYVHLLIHGALVVLFTGSWPMAITIVVTHAAIDLLKVYSLDGTNARAWFAYDQLLHISVIAVVAAIETNTGFATLGDWTSRHIIMITAIVLLTRPASICISTFISRWRDDIESEDSEALARAGNYIGIIERLFVFAFVMSGQWNAVGFLIAAKSVFRFGDLKEAQDRKLTEYILVGTLLSIGIASIVALAVQNFGR